VSMYFTPQAFAKSSTITPVSHKKKNKKKQPKKIASSPTAQAVGLMS
jgi:hypothetical protein